MYEVPSLEVYLDMLFILNFVMDYFIFWMVSKITYQKVSYKRLCFGSIIAATLYCLIVIIPFLRSKNIVFYLVVLPLIPIKIIFNPKKLKKWVQTFIISNITALIIGGMSYGLFYWIQEQNIVSTIYKKTYDGFSMWLLISSILVSYLVIQLSRYYMQKRNIDTQKLYQVKIQYNTQTVVLEALLDTGNKVYDPITKQPVIIVEYAVLEALLPERIKTCYKQENADVSSIVQVASTCEFGTRIRLIPYHSLGNPNGILLGFKADSIYIEDDELKDRLIEDVVIAIYQHKLSAEDTYGGLLHGDLVN